MGDFISFEHVPVLTFIKLVHPVRRAELYIIPRTVLCRDRHGCSPAVCLLPVLSPLLRALTVLAGGGRRAQTVACDTRTWDSGMVLGVRVRQVTPEQSIWISGTLEQGT